MKAILLPLFFKDINEREEREFQAQIRAIEGIYQAEAELLPPQCIEAYDDSAADAILLPQLVGAAYHDGQKLKNSNLPVVVITSGFGTVEMWDWEIVSYFRTSLSLEVFTPYSVELGKVILRSLALKREMKTGTRFLMLQDSPGEGMQANIFKRFFWWEAECTQRIKDSFGVEIIYESYRKVNQDAEEISDAEARELLQERAPHYRNIPEENLLKAVKLYLAIRNLIGKTGGILGAGANCLNESFHSCTTPCLAWNWLFEYDGIMWACEGDTLSLLSQFILYSALRKPLLMSNLYPFLMGMAALKHEKITQFPNVYDPDHYALAAHCGYFGLAPQSMCANWTLKPKVLEIVNENALMVDCEFPLGPVTIAKLHADMKKLTLIEAELAEYAQYPGSDCRNGGLIRFTKRTGHEIMENLSSHHAIIIVGNVIPDIRQMAKVFGLSLELL